MKNWVTKKLGEVCVKITDGSHNPPKGVMSSDFIMLSSKNIFDDLIHYEEPRYLTQKDFENENKRTEVKNNDVLLTIVGTIGRVAVVPSNHPKFALQRSVAVLKTKENILDSRFLMFSLQNILKFLTDEARGVAQKGIYLNQLRDIEIPLPPLSEQQRIVSILDDAFAKIGKAKANAEQNLKNAKELFESYLQGVFENKGDDWEENVLKEVCELKSGTTISPLLERTEGDVLYIKVGDMNLPYNEVEINTSSRFVRSKEIKMNQIVPEGAIIFPKRGGAIATNKKRKIVKPTIVDLNTMAIIPSKKIDNDYFYHWFKLFDLNSISNGANIPQINNYSFDDVYLAYPKSLKEQIKIVQKLDALSVETKKLEVIYKQKINDLDELKKSVLQKAFSGEI
jgi:type I restriction enzyme S subunit